MENKEFIPEFVLDEKFVGIPNGIMSDCRYLGARMKYQRVFQVILRNAAFENESRWMQNKMVNIQIGQFFYISSKNLADLCNEGVRFREDKLDPEDVTRAIKYFEKCNFLKKEVIEGKQVISVKVKEIKDGIDEI